MQIFHWNHISTCLVHLSLFTRRCSFIENEQKQYLNQQTDEDKWSRGALFWLFSLCQFRDSTVDRRRTCCRAVTICHFCTVIVSFCCNAIELIRPDSNRTLTQKRCFGSCWEDLEIWTPDLLISVCLFHPCTSGVAPPLKAASRGRGGWRRALSPAIFSGRHSGDS